MNSNQRAVTNNKKEYHNCHISKEVCDAERTRDLTPEDQSLLPGTCFPRSSSPVESLVPSYGCNPFLHLAMQGSYPHFTDDETETQEVVYLNTGLQLDLYLDSNDWPPSNSTIARRLMSLAVLLLTILSALLLKKVLGATFMSPCSYNLPLCRILC